ncbi:D-tyrosyl-tRNA(Tyr) deacylase [Idiomarina sp. 29L]|uniref:D-aminoacyl-tRNA deacylase n=1 Tax=Idiomarina sp. 29L TaxID=2508877 RepID=UPI001011BDE7|nr:D-aminoacyl-tRNA deacylase [Idiomarina sp. 29L]RXS41482.1 D-tyrosyl-tRNA(Tyr) deacylase [Idiomarina sp. 29L]
MIGLIQRVSRAQVTVDNQSVGSIDKGLLVLLGVEHADDEAAAEKLAQRIANYRVFTDSEGKMNNSVIDESGSVLVVSQFTLAADTRKGRRPSFSSAATPEQAKALYLHFCDAMKKLGLPVETGQFAADMQVELVNNGPVTFELRV